MGICEKYRLNFNQTIDISFIFIHFDQLLYFLLKVINFESTTCFRYSSVEICSFGLSNSVIIIFSNSSFVILNVFKNY